MPRFLQSLPQVVAEAMGVAVAGLCLALLLNAVSPRGLQLSRDYFPTAPVAGAGAVSGRTNGSAVLPTNGAAAGTVDTPATRLAAKGLRAVDFAEVRRLHDDPKFAQELVVFIDARNDSHYQEEHIPGAYSFDRYYPEKYLPLILPACLQAETIVVYCRGGACEDSEFAAIALRDAGVPAERIAVYVGGITDWMTQQMPVEIGIRGSGDIRYKAP